MVYIPFNVAQFDEEEASPDSNICQFPALVTADANLREAQRQLARCQETLANDDPKSADLRESIRAVGSAAMLPLWEERLAEAEANVATLRAEDALSYRGRVYQAIRHSAGPN